MAKSVEVVLELALIIILGFILGRVKMIKIIDHNGSKLLSRFLVNVTLPCLIVTSLQRDFTLSLRNESLSLLLIGFVIYLVSTLIFWKFPVLLGARGNERGVLSFGSIYSNVGFVGIPVVQALFGNEPLFFVALFAIPFNLMVFSFGILMLNEGRGKINPLMLLNMPILSALLGFAFFMLNFHLPEIVKRPMTLLGDMTTPLSLIIVGAILARANFKRIFLNYRVYIVSLVRLLVHPLLAYVPLYYLGFRGWLLIVPVILLAMPAATNLSVLVDLYDSDRETASSIILITSLLFIVSLPILTHWLFGV